MMVKRVLDKTLFKFVIVGIINTLLGMAIMFGLYNLAGVPYWISTAANYVIVSFLSFYLNKRFTFRHEGNVIQSGLRFALNIGVCYLLAYGAAKPWAMLMLGGQELRFQENIAMLVGMCLFTLLNYLGQRLFVFSDGGRGLHGARRGRSRAELEAEFQEVMAREDDREPGCYFDREALERRREKVLEAARRNVIATEPPEEIAEMIRAAEAEERKRNGEESFRPED